MKTGSEVLYVKLPWNGSPTETPGTLLAVIYPLYDTVMVSAETSDAKIIAKPIIKTFTS